MYNSLVQAHVEVYAEHLSPKIHAYRSRMGLNSGLRNSVICIRLDQPRLPSPEEAEIVGMEILLSRLEANSVDERDAGVYRVLRREWTGMKQGEIVVFAQFPFNRERSPFPFDTVVPFPLRSEV
ncbi:hypothetical protein PM082_020169 [Marasmius tenuissimus]|nr:hypothetical protein PM082_020169 [Marasmius tenuissimus]